MQILKMLSSPVAPIWRHLSKSNRVGLAGSVLLMQLEIIFET
jgi:hypothetical protein